MGAKAASDDSEVHIEDPTRLGGDAYCGRCHTDIYHQWNASSHHFSSFNNPIYRKVFSSAAEENDPETMMFCSNCHDPILTSSGQSRNPDMRSWAANTGITCLSCHRIKDPLVSNGQFKIEEPLLHPLTIAKSPTLSYLHELAIKIAPALHTATVSDPSYSSSEICATCHTLIVPSSINGEIDITFTNEYEQLHSNSIKTAHGDVGSGSAKCQSCHMPEVESNDPAAKDGYVRSHAFATSNNVLPTFNRDFEQVREIEKFLSSGKISLRLAGARKNGEQDFSALDMNKFQPGDSIEIAVHVINQGVGHQFPTGTVDSNEAWISLVAKDRIGSLLVSQASIKDSDPLPDDAVRFGTWYVDADGNPTDRRNTTTKAVAVSKNTTIPKGAMRTVYFDFTIPDEALFPMTISLNLNWRKYNPEFLEWVFDGREVPVIPIIVMANLDVVIN